MNLTIKVVIHDSDKLTAKDIEILVKEIEKTAEIESDCVATARCEEPQ